MESSGKQEGPAKPATVPPTASETPVKPPKPEGGNARPITVAKTSIDLNALMTGKSARAETNGNNPTETPRRAPSEPASPEAIQKAWADFAETRRLQVAEYMVLRRPIEVTGQKITMTLTNPVEETLLTGIRNDLLQWIREALNDPTVTLETDLQMTTTTRAAFTNREKLEELQNRYPIIGELCDRLGLDPDY